MGNELDILRKGLKEDKGQRMWVLIGLIALLLSAVIQDMTLYVLSTICSVMWYIDLRFWLLDKRGDKQ